ncbi:MAG: PDZ domain-containing protein [Thermoanaerobaculaceae bacterium]|nr:PDZ domain-containing protein [Thermoanaerobaculaceae bacterium]
MTLRTMLHALAVVILACPLPTQLAAQPAPLEERQSREEEEAVRDAERQLHEAEARLQEAAERLAELQRKRVEREVFIERHAYFGDQARLGIVVQTEADPRVDTVGAKVLAVTPGGPADEAGLRAGDIVTAIDGEPLVGPTDDLDVDEDESAPAASLVERLDDLEAGQKVEVEYRRGKETKKVTVTARALPEPVVRIVIDRDSEVPLPPPAPVPEPPRFRSPEGRGVAPRAWERDWQKVEMVALNPELGRYFGTEEGVLLTKVPPESALQLQAGDVLLAIDGRKTTRPSAVLRIVSSYEAGETVRLEVLRERNRVTLSVTVPGDAQGARGSAAPPAPASPPGAGPQV